MFTMELCIIHQHSIHIRRPAHIPIRWDTSKMWDIINITGQERIIIPAFQPAGFRCLPMAVIFWAADIIITALRQTNLIHTVTITTTKPVNRTVTVTIWPVRSGKGRKWQI